MRVPVGITQLVMDLVHILHLKSSAEEVQSV